MTRAELRTEILQRLGDSDAAIWTAAELNTYIKEGLDRLTLATGLLWDFACFPDYPSAFNYTFDDELDHIESVTSWRITAQAQFTSSFERDYVDNARGPANHNFRWEYIGGYVSTMLGAALVNLPDNLHEIERATWNNLRIDPLRSRDLEGMDSRYELNAGAVEGYVQDKDGLSTLRKWRVPSSAYSGYTYDSDSSEYGLMRQIAAVCSDTPNGRWGDVVSVPGEEVSNGPWGVVRCFYKAAHDVKIEYRKRAEPVDADTKNFDEIPARYVQYVRWFVLGEALGREGDGQELELSVHYRSRFATGISRIIGRRLKVDSQRIRVMGGGARRSSRMPRARLPWPYPAAR